MVWTIALAGRLVGGRPTLGIRMTGQPSAGWELAANFGAAGAELGPSYALHTRRGDVRCRARSIEVPVQIRQRTRGGREYPFHMYDPYTRCDLPAGDRCETGQLSRARPVHSLPPR